jgi:hypothetical protein
MWVALWKSRVGDKRCGICFFLLFVISLGSPQVARADLITTLSASERPDAGMFQYAYTLTESPQSTIPAYIFVLAVDSAADLQSVTAPPGWEALYVVGSTAVEWDTAFQPIAPGGSADFSFLSVESPALNMYQVTGFDPIEFQFFLNTGTTISPATAVAVSVPEPSGLFLCMAALVCLCLRALIRRCLGSYPIPAKETAG